MGKEKAAKQEAKLVQLEERAIHAETCCGKQPSKPVTNNVASQMYWKSTRTVLRVSVVLKRNTM